MNGLMISNALRGEIVDGVFVPFDEMDERTFECTCCGELHLNENGIEFDSQMWCEECLDDATFVCDRCGERHYNEDLFSVRVGGWDESWCAECEEDTYICDDCGERVPYDDTTSTASGRRVCDCCLSNDYTYCDECDEYVPNDEYDYDADMCYECRDRTQGGGEASSDNAYVRAYHCPPPMRWFGDERKGIGVELEVDAPYGTEINLQAALNGIDTIAGERLYFEHDGSLNRGFEIITQPHTLEAFEEIPWAAIMQICKDNGFQSHDVETCGLHVHFSREMFGDDTDTQDDNIAKLTQFIEMHWDDMVRASRRTESQLHWTHKKGTISKKKLKDAVKNKTGGHYDAVNNSNAHTVEIRLMRGTLNVDSFKACIDLLVALVRNACRIEWDEVCEAEEMLKGISDNTIRYLISQSAFTNAVYEMQG